MNNKKPSEHCNSLNICATNFTKSRPDQTIASVLTRTSKGDHSKFPVTSSEVQFIELSSDEGENARDDPVHLEDSDQDDIEQSAGTSLPSPTRSLNAQAPPSQDDDLVFVGEERPAVMSCKECGSRLFAFSAEAHMKFHEESEKVTRKAEHRQRRQIKKGKDR